VHASHALHILHSTKVYQCVIISYTEFQYKDGYYMIIELATHNAVSVVFGYATQKDGNIETSGEALGS